MKAWRSSSLHWRLTLSLLFVTGLVWVLVLGMTWFKTAHELNELLDAHLAQRTFMGGDAFGMADIVLAAAAVGYVGGRLAPERFKAGGGHGKAGKTEDCQRDA